MTEPLPETGHPSIDQACREVADLSAVPLAEHTERLARAHEQMSAALQNVPLVPLPDTPRP